MHVAVNVSPLEFEQSDVLSTVRETLAETGLPPSRLELEITEGVMIGGSHAVIRTLEALREMGVAIALDDFGTGYSSLSYLRKLPFDRLKIDQSFVRGLPDEEGSTAVARTIVSLARSLEKTIVAEGVETAEQWTWLTDVGCDTGQGFYFGRPVPAQDIEQAMKSSRTRRLADYVASR